MADVMGGGEPGRKTSDDLLEELDREMDAKVYDEQVSAPPRTHDMDERLAELKRRMGQE